MKEIDQSLGCLISVIAVGLLVLMLFHGSEIANLLLGNCHAGT